MQVPNERFVLQNNGEPLNKGHPYITAKMLFPKGGRYIEGFHCSIPHLFSILLLL